MRAAGFEPLVFEDAQDLLLDQLNGINGVRLRHVIAASRAVACEAHAMVCTRKGCQQHVFDFPKAEYTVLYNICTHWSLACCCAPTATGTFLRI